MTRPVVQLVTLELPLCPSVNDAFASKHGSHMLMKTARYRAWTRSVKDEHGDGSGLPMLPHGPYGLFVELPLKMRGDIDNRVKLNSDAIRAQVGDTFGLGIVADDGDMKALYVEHADLPADRCRLTVVALSDWLSYVVMRLS